MFLYKSAVTKHGSHNQKTHAGSRGGGGGGAGGGTPKAPSVGRDNVGSGIQDIKGLTDSKMGKLIDQEGTNTKYALTQLSDDLQSYAEDAESVAELKEISQTVTLLTQASQLAGKVSSIKGSKGKLAQIDKINVKLERAFEKIPDGREMKVLEEYLADGLDFVDNYREALPNLKA